MEKKKLPYYVFLDIDGTLWDARFAYYYYGSGFNNVPYPRLKKESVEAVNLLLRSLENKYDPTLILTSKKREYMPECIEYLKRYGLDYAKPIISLPFGNNSRGARIIKYMQSQNSKPEHLSKPQNLLAKLLDSFIIKGNQNYVVLEDEYKIIKNTIPSRRLIFSDHNKKSITHKQVEHYLKQNKIPILEKGKVSE